MSLWQQESVHLDQLETVRELQQRMEKAKRDRGQLLLDLGQKQYRAILRSGDTQAVEMIMVQDVLIYETGKRIREMQEAMKPNRCISCEASLEKDAKFCGSCGTPAPQPDVRPKSPCSSCGTPQPIDISFCTCCGGQLGAMQ
ncbi:zinc ribbon domain-containing protein [Exiguobacterium sp. s151]|uniref:zinc ribbon domain-containing protein n=1 Tax=Exiguobacterium sp. s151 TaxID=2751229 RepID=UPI001BE66740|nr:zinc ribbon domain-containing protein [Exiguobacterium sp. s151]